MNRPLRVGLVGMGSAAELFHLPAIAGRSDIAELVRVADPSAERLARTAELTGLPPGRLHQDATDLITSDDVDVVDLVMPPHVRSQYLLAAAKAGKHIISEKPLGLTPADAAEAAAAARDSGVYLANVHNWLFFPEVAELRRLVVSGELGEIRAAFVNVMGLAPFPATASFRPTWRNDHTVSGGGVLMDFVHAVYLAESLLDAQTRRVNAVVSNSDPESTVEDFAALQLETDRGVGLVYLALGQGSTGFEILGSKGGARAGFELNSQGRTSWVDVTMASGTRHLDLGTVPGMWTAFIETIGHIFDDLAAAVSESRPPLADGEEGVRMIEVAVAAYQSAAEARRVTVPLPRSSPLFAYGVGAIADGQVDELSAVARQHLFGVS